MQKEQVNQDIPEGVQVVSTEVDIPPEVEHIGVVAHRDTIEIPPDVAKLGVHATGTAVPTSSALPQVSLPISDTQIAHGLQAQITQAIRWLAVACIRRLHRAHLTLRIVHGKLVRVKFA